METLYNKKFKFSDEHNQWKLPDSSAWFENDREPFQVEGLLKVKKELNDTKSSLDDVELTSWNRHTHFTNRSGIVIPAVRRDFEPEMCTQVSIRIVTVRSYRSESKFDWACNILWYCDQYLW